MNKLSVATAVFLGCVPLSGCGKNSNVTNIERVLKADTTTTTGVRSIADVATRMRTISLTGCPPDFSAAYVAHIHAWELFAEVEGDAIVFDANFNSGEAMVEAFIRGIMLDPFGKALEATAEQNRLRANYQRAQIQIRETFHRVEEIAVAHGAELPKKLAQTGKR